MSELFDLAVKIQNARRDLRSAGQKTDPNVDNNQPEPIKNGSVGITVGRGSQDPLHNDTSATRTA